MQLIGMLDSPYVRRTAIALDVLGIPFEHKVVAWQFTKYPPTGPGVKAKWGALKK